MAKQLQREPLRTQLRHLILEQILSGEFAPGQALNLGDLAEEWEISRTPLREALLTLEEEGLVGSERGRGFFVWPLSRQEAANLYQIAGALERLAVRSMQDSEPPPIDVLRTINGRLREVQGRPEAMIKWDGEFHRQLVRSTPNDDLLDLIKKIRNRLYRYRSYGYEYDVTQGLDEKRKSVKEHESIIDCLSMGDIPEAAKMLEEHWERGTKLMEKWLAHPAGEMEREFPSSTGQRLQRPGGNS